VLRDPNLSTDRKRETLRRWALDAYQVELEHSQGKPETELSQLQEVIDALLDLDEPRITSESCHNTDRRVG
jgi:hypothetical protein